jgi:hypothetical protein
VASNRPIFLWATAAVVLAAANAAANATMKPGTNQHRLGDPREKREIEPLRLILLLSTIL